jgi:hypothetical protein
LAGVQPDNAQEHRHFPVVFKLQPVFVTVSTREIMGNIWTGFFLSCGLMLSTVLAHAQNLSGQWSGTFATSNDPFGGKTEYVMELEIKGDRVDGHSYTYFIISGKRHYVICRLEGSYDKGSKSVIVTEKEKVKSNTPPDFKDLFQTHRLTYFRQDDREVLEGKWRPASEKEPPQFGMTTLERRALAKVQTAAPTPDITKRTPLGTAPVAGNRVIASNKPAPKPAPKQTPPVAQTPKPSQPQPSTPGIAAITTPRIQPPTPGTRERPSEAGSGQTRTDAPAKLQPPTVASTNTTPITIETGTGKIEQRTKRYIEVIELDDPQFKVELYDNGQVDGDTISLFFNNRLMVAQKRLSTTPISLELMLDKSKPDNELVMYAENLGSIPPNTALMVVTVKDKRYEVNITSTEDVNGAVRFRLRQ